MNMVSSMFTANIGATNDGEDTTIITTEPSTLTTEPSTITTEPSTIPTNKGKIEGCAKHVRERCKDKREVLVQIPTEDLVYCQKYCNKEHPGECQSFEHNSTSLNCTLFGNRIGDIFQCQSIGGPDLPTFELCRSYGCQVIIFMLNLPEPQRS